MKLRTKLSKKCAISTVLTTVIILVSSAVLIGGVVLYGVTLFEVGTLQEQLVVYGPKLWVHATNTDGLSWGASAIRNTGGTVLSINLIQIRGINVPFSNWYADLDVDANLSTQELEYTGWVGGGQQNK